MRPARPGFTLIELVVVLAILGLTAAAAAPALLDTTDDETAPGAHEVVRILEASRAAALQRAEAVTVDVAWAAARYHVEARSEARPLAEGHWQVPSGTKFVSSNPRARFSFFPDGTAAGPIVTVQDADGTSTITIDRWTGDVALSNR